MNINNQGLPSGDMASPLATVTAPEVTRITRSGARRRGDEYQDAQALDLLIGWLERNELFQWVQLEADEEVSDFLDDIKAMRSDGILEVWQVKYSTATHRSDDAWTWDLLLKQSTGQRGPKPSLLQKWFGTWQLYTVRGEPLVPTLTSNRSAAPELLLDTPQSGNVQWERLPEGIRQRIAEQLGSEGSAVSFFEAFRFRLEAPGLRELADGAYTRFQRLGGTASGWHALQRQVREWVNTKNLPAPEGHISLEELRRATKLKAHPVRLNAFLPHAAFFDRYVETGHIFHHHIPQVGRREQLNALLRFTDGSSQIALLSGRGGSGKSKLLHTFCRHLERRHPELNVRLAAENLPITAAALEELPDDACLVIVDDAHRAVGLEVVLTAARQNPTLKVLLVTRPHAAEFLTAQAMNAGFSRGNITAHPPLPDLDYRREHRRLARLVLGREWADYADDLALVTRDCPLLAVLGGQLLRTKQIPPSFLVHDDDFRQEVMSRFRDIQLGEIIRVADSRFEQQACSKTLAIVSAITPFDTGNEKLVQVAAELTGTAPEDLKRLLGVLVKSGVAARGGRFIRIVPDVLSDFLLEDACITQDGLATGWADRIYKAVAEADLDFSSLLRNLAELDWRVRSRGNVADQDTASHQANPGGELLAGIWHDIEQRFRKGNLPERKAWLNRLERLASMQPSYLWPIVEAALEEPASEDPDEIVPSLRRYLQPTSQADIDLALIPILGGIACFDRRTSACAEVLWEMARDTPDRAGTAAKAIHELCNLASFERFKPISFNAIILDCCRGWIQEPSIHQYPHPVLLVIAPMLARHIQWSEIRGRWLSHGSYTLSPESFCELRKGALDLLRECALSGIQGVVLQAMGMLDMVFGEVGLWEIREEDPDVWETWTEEQLDAIDIVRAVARKDDNPFVRLKIWEVLHWSAEHSPRPSVRDQARTILTALPKTFEERFILLMTHRGGWEQYYPTWKTTRKKPRESPGGNKHPVWSRSDHSRATLACKVIQEWIERYPDPRDGFDAFGAWIERIDKSVWWDGHWTRGNLFLEQLVANYPSYALAWCEMALEQPDSHVVGKCEDLLCELRRQDPHVALDLVHRFLAHNDPNLWLRAAASYSWRGWPTNPLPEEWEVLRQLLNIAHPVVLRCAAQIIPYAAATDRQRTLGLVAESQFDRDAVAADTVYQIFNEGDGCDVETLTPEQFTSLLGKLRAITNLNHYHLGVFLRQASLRDPIAVVNLLLDRVRHTAGLNANRQAVMSEAGNDRLREIGDVSTAFHGLPRAGFHDERFKEVATHKEYVNALRNIRDAALDPNYNSFSWEDTLAELFRDFSLGYCPASLDVLNEWIDSGDKDKIDSCVRLLRHTHLNFYLDNLPFLSNLLRSAWQYGNVTFASIRKDLLGYAQFGPPGAMASRRGERSRKLFDGTTTALRHVNGDARTTAFLEYLRDRGQEMLASEMRQDAEEEAFFR